jgi:uncharacterized integral membrane protein
VDPAHQKEEAMTELLRPEQIYGYPQTPPSRPILTALGCIAMLALILTLLVVLCWMPVEAAGGTFSPWKIGEWVGLTIIAVVGAFVLFILMMTFVGRKRR